MKRWLALIASTCMLTCLGMVYAWSTFVPALREEHWVHLGHAGVIFGICIASFTISMVFGGILQHRHGPRRVGAAGGLLFLTGYLTGSYSGGSFPILLLGFGVVAGAGIGCGYVCALASGVKWFPDHKGLIAGLTVAGFGLGSVFFSKLGLHWLEQGVPVLQILRNMGVFIGMVVMLASGFLFLPENMKVTAQKRDLEIPLLVILKMKEFRLLFFMIFCGTFGGLLIIGNLKPISLGLGLTPAQSIFVIMLFAIGNAVGRILWGLIYDRFGVHSIIWCMLLLAIGAGTMGLFNDKAAFYGATLLIAFAFGGCFVLFAARVADSFGVNRVGEIYPFVFLGYGIAGLIGPGIGGYLLYILETRVIATLCVVVVALIGAAAARVFSSLEIKP